MLVVRCADHWKRRDGPRPADWRAAIPLGNLVCGHRLNGGDETEIEIFLKHTGLLRTVRAKCFVFVPCMIRKMCLIVSLCFELLFCHSIAARQSYLLDVLNSSGAFLQKTQALRSETQEAFKFCMSRRTQLSVNCRQRYLQLAQVAYTDEKGATRQWEMVQRWCTRTADASSADSPPPPRMFEVDCVDICARVIHAPLVGSPSAESIVVISQYRPPVDAICLEFPAGIIDPGEDPITAALRELREETGLVAGVSSCTLSPPLAYEPGMTDSCFHFVSIVVDGSHAENRAPKQCLDEGEFIQVYYLPKEGFLSQLLELQRSLGNGRCVIDSKLYTFAVALGLT
jgi:8-oxo-dGTP pyrophosphatase MutT (NUDIX family)